MAEQQPITYVILGDDWNGAFKGFKEAYKGRKDVVFIEPKEGEYLDQAIKNAHIQEGANIILACHGVDDRHINWKDGKIHGAGGYSGLKESYVYWEFFDMLPQGVSSITIDSCFSGLSQELVDLPRGAIVHTLVSDKTPGYEYLATQFAKETVGQHNPVDLLIKGLDNIDPVAVAKSNADWNKKDEEEYKKNHNGSSEGFQPQTTDPNQVLSKQIMIGGPIPYFMNLDHEREEIGRRANAGMLDEPAFERATKRVQWLFDTKNGLDKIDHSADAEAKLDDHIAKVAEKMKHYSEPKNYIKDAEEMRIAYALSIAYADESKKLGRIVNEYKRSSQDADKGDGANKPKAEVHNNVKTALGDIPQKMQQNGVSKALYVNDGPPAMTNGANSQQQQSSGKPSGRYQ